MLYYDGIEEIIFSKHELISEEPDELIIISGYLGPSPIERLSELPMKVTIIGGMYSNGIDKRLWDSLNNSLTSNTNLSIYFSKQQIHSKIYIWKKNSKILSALIGSANFSSSGLRTSYRESLADATRDTFVPLNSYYEFIMNNSTTTPTFIEKQEIIDFPVNHKQIYQTNLETKYSFDIPLYSERGTKEVPPSSGLNWGLGNGHVSEGDAYIRLPKKILLENQNLIRPFAEDYTTSEGHRERNSDPIELVWDDGTVMEASLEGVQNFNNHKYPKQLASYSSKQPYQNGKRISKKSILGRYLRSRIGVSINHMITLSDLEKYGRTTITLSLIDEGIYYADFSAS